MIRGNKTRTSAVSLFAVGSLLLLSACADDSADSDPTESSAAGSTTPAPSAGQSDDLVACAPFANGEEATLRHGSTTDAQVFENFVEPFKERYPGIDLQFTSSQPQDQVQQIITQNQTGREIEIDSFSTWLAFAAPLVEADLIGQTDWEALGVAESKILPVTDDISVFRTYRMWKGLVYNTELISEDELPDTWEELVDPQWAGKGVVDPRGTHLSALALVWGEEKTVDWYADFMETARPLVVQGATASLQRVISGEALFSTSAHDAETAEQNALGASLGIKYLDIVPVQEYYGFVIAGSPNEAAAECFLSWYASEEGQEQQFKFEFKDPRDEIPEVPSDSERAGIETFEDADLVGTVGAELAALTSS